MNIASDLDLHALAEAYGFEPSLERGIQPELTKNWPADHQMAYALLVGNAQLAWTMWKEQGPFTLDLSCVDDFSGLGNQLYRSTNHENGEDCVFPLLLKPAPVRNLCLALMHASGLLGTASLDRVFREGDSAVQRSGEKGADVPSHTWGVDELPTLADDLVTNPELVSALRASHPLDHVGFFDDVLCWATPEMVEAYPSDLYPFDLEQMVTLAEHSVGDYGEINFRHGSTVPMASVRQSMVNDFGAVELPDGELDLSQTGSVIVKSVLARIFVAGREARLEDARLIRCYGDKLLQLGYGREGLRLCATKVAFLDRFASKSLNPSLVDQLKHNLRDSYFGWVSEGVFDDYYRNQLTRGQLFESDEMTGRSFLLKIGTDADRLVRTVPLLPRSLMAKTLSCTGGRGANPIKLPEYKFLRSLNIGCADLAVVIYDDELDEVLSEGIRFEADSNVNLIFKGDAIRNDLERRVAGYEKLFHVLPLPSRVGIYEFSGSTMGDLALLGTSEHPVKNADKLMGDIRFRGLDHFAQRASTDDEWRGLIKVFGYRTLMNSKHEIPRHLRVQQAGHQLSL
ncbi:hypothetical protein ACYPKM_01275 [Pseudomonas aeruginosa]